MTPTKQTRATEEALRAANGCMSRVFNEDALTDLETDLASVIDSATGLPALLAFKEGVIRNAPACGACAEALFCGSTNAPHTCAIAERDQLREALRDAEAVLSDLECTGDKPLATDFVLDQARKALEASKKVDRT